MLDVSTGAWLIDDVALLEEARIRPEMKQTRSKRKQTLIFAGMCMIWCLVSLATGRNTPG